ncbi:MAG: LPS export ABC transporter periplasmic protein LptC [Bacteroidota bacterium]
MITRFKIFLFAGMVLILSAGCEEKIKPSVLQTGIQGEMPTQESWNTTVTFSDSGKIKAVLHAGHIAKYASQRMTFIDGNVRVDFYDNNENHTSVLTSRKANVNDLNHDLEAIDNVVVVSDSGTILRTEQLQWTNATRIIHTKSFVSISSATEDLQGTGLESDQSLKNYKIFNVSGESKKQK